MMKIQKYQEIGKIPTNNAYPLSFQQERLWYLSRIIPENPYWNRFSCKLLKGRLDYERLKKTLVKIIERHPVLMTTVNDSNEAPQLAEAPVYSLPFSVIDFKKNSREKRIEQFNSILMELAYKPIILNRDPLFEMILYCVDDNSHYLLLKLHHIISDATGFQILWRDLKDIYNGKIEQLPSLSISYYDYAIWQKKTFSEENTKIEETYWINKFRQELPVLQLPTDFQPLSPLSFQGSSESQCIDKEMVKQVERFSLKHKTMSFSTFMAVFYLLLKKYCQSDDIIIGTVFSGRHYHRDLKHMAGFFVNTVALREKIDEEIDFESFLSQVHKSVTEAYEHQNFPFERLIQKINPGRSGKRFSLFSVVFNFLTEYDDSVLFDGIENETAITIPTAGTQVDLSLEVKVRPDGAVITFEYNSELFLPASIKRMLHHYIVLLKDILKTPAKKLYEYNLMDEQEHKQWLKYCCGPIKEYDRGKCIHQLFEDQVRKTPNNKALIYSGKSLTYEQLNERANRLAGFLRRTFIKPGDFVGLCFDRSIEMIEAMLAVLKAGGAYVPIDPKFPKERMAAIIADSGLAMLLCKDKNPDILPELSIPIIALNSEQDRWAYEDGNNFEGEYNSGDLAYVIYTSGSTGKPKGVAISHYTVINLIQWVNNTFKIESSDCLLFTTSYCFDLSVYDVFGTLASGATVRIASEYELENPDILVRIMINEPVTFWDSAPARLQQLTPLFHEGVRGNHLRLVFLSGDWIPVTLPDKVKAAFPNARVISLGGATEATVWSNWYPVEKVEPDWKSIPYGKPIPNCRYYILDEHLMPCPINVPGNLYIAGECLFKEYINDLAKTQDKLIPDPFASDENSLMYRTGDIARFFPDGNMEFLGREDFQVKIHGYRIELGEIETLLSNHPAVNHALVITVDDQLNNKQLAAYVVLKEINRITEKTIREYLFRYLPDYMVPQHIIFLESIPLTANGKVDRKALSIPSKNSQAAGKKEKPGTPIEKILCQTWMDFLKKDSLYTCDNFFDMGGHSLLATQVIFKLREIFQVELSMGILLQCPTIALLAEHIEEIKIQNQKKEFPPQPVGAALDREVGKI